MMPIGQDRNWAAVTTSLDKVTALDADGSLWQWKVDYEDANRAGLIEQSPARLGSHHDWVAVGSAMGGTVSLAAPVAKS